jgi:hypothetical protein
VAQLGPGEKKWPSKFWAMQKFLLSRKIDKNENNGPGVKLIEVKNIKAWAITKLKRKTRARSEIMARAKN